MKAEIDHNTLKITVESEDEKHLMIDWIKNNKIINSNIRMSIEDRVPVKPIVMQHYERPTTPLPKPLPYY